MDGQATIDTQPEIRITLHDLTRLEALLDRLAGNQTVRAVTFLRAEIDRAVLIDSTPEPDRFVKIGSKVLFRDDSGRVYRGTLALPGQTLEQPDAIPIMTGVGTALLGLSPGQTMTYETAGGRTRSVTVLTVDEATVTAFPERRR